MSTPSSARASHFVRGLQRLEATARSRREEGTKGPDGHYRAATATLGGYRISVRYNRHKQREVSVCRRNKDHYHLVPADVLDAVSAAHREIYGAGLQVAYTEPRRRGNDPVYWAVLHTDATNVQGSLG